MAEFIHEYSPSPSGSNVGVLALHATGGNEQQLFGLARSVAPNAAILSPRGKSTDEPALRFFRRHAEGLLDLDDLRAKAAELAGWIREKRAEHGLERLYALGYSNGANMASALLILHPDALDGMANLRGMELLESDIASLAGKEVLIASGERDPLVEPSKIIAFARLLEQAGAKVEHAFLPVGHELTRADAQLASNWFSRLVE